MPQQVTGLEAYQGDDTLFSFQFVDGQTLTVTASGGTYTLAYNGVTTGPLAYNASAATIQTALAGTAATVTGTGPFTVVVPDPSLPMTVDTSGLTGGGATLTDHHPDLSASTFTPSIATEVTNLVNPVTVTLTQDGTTDLADGLLVLKLAGADTANVPFTGNATIARLVFDLEETPRWEGAILTGRISLGAKRRSGDRSVTDVTVYAGSLATEVTAAVVGYVDAAAVLASANSYADRAVASGDATTLASAKTYADEKVEAVASGFAPVGPVRAVATSDIGLSYPFTGTTTVDTVALADDDRVLLTGQTAGTRNGVWVVGSPWTRPADYPTGGNATAKDVAVLEGSLGGSSWAVSSAAPNVIDTNVTTWAQVAAPTIPRPTAALDGLPAAWDDTTKQLVDASSYLFGQVQIPVAAKFDGTDEVAALQAAIGKIVAAGGCGTLLVHGKLRFSSPPDFTGVTSLAIVGVSPAFGIGLNQPSQLIYTGSGSADALSLTGRSGVHLVNVGITYTDAGFTGVLVNLDGVAGVTDGSCHRIVGCNIRPTGTLDTHAALISLDRCHTIDLDNNLIIGSKAIRGKKTAGSYSNRVTIRGGYLQGLASPPVWNPGAVWVAAGVTFEPLTGQVAGAFGHDAGVTSDGIALRGCYLADDSTATAGAWVTFAGTTCEVTGSELSAQASGSSVVKPDGTNDGPITVAANTTHLNTLAYLVDLSAATTPKHLLLDGNAYSNFPAKVVNGTVPYGSIIRQPNAGVYSYIDGGHANAHWADAAGRYLDLYRVIGDTGDRFRIRADGTLLWGNGAGVTDLNIARASTTNGGVVLDIASGGIRLQGRCKIFSGSGAPAVGGDAGDMYIRQDTPTVSLQRIYMCTVSGVAGSATWVGVV